MIEKTETNGAPVRDSVEDPPLVEPSHPVRYVLIAFTLLGGAGLILIYFLSDGVFGP